MNICVYCSASMSLEDKYYRLGYEFGREIANLDCGLVYGGHAAGIMEKVAEGVSEAGGKVTGVVPDVFAGNVSSFADEVIRVDSMGERKNMMESLSDAIAVLPGGIGTMDEFFEVFVLKKLGQYDKPIAVYNMDGFYDSLKGLLDEFEVRGFLSKRAASCVKFFDDPKEMIRYLTGESDI